MSWGKNSNGIITYENGYGVKTDCFIKSCKGGSNNCILTYTNIDDFYLTRVELLDKNTGIVRSVGDGNGTKHKARLGKINKKHKYLLTISLTGDTDYDKTKPEYVLNIEIN